MVVCMTSFTWTFRSDIICTAAKLLHATSLKLFSSEEFSAFPSNDHIDYCELFIFP